MSDAGQCFQRYSGQGLHLSLGLCFQCYFSTSSGRTVFWENGLDQVHVNVPK